MTFSWRRRSGGTKKGGDSKAFKSDMELIIPTHFRCPISLDLMKDPVTLSTGITYDRESVERWIDLGSVTCPVTNQVLMDFDQTPNHSIRKMIQDWCVENKSYGVERIPTPRIPITPYQVSEISSAIISASQCGDVKKFLDLVLKIKNLAKESERNKRCIVNNGIGSALAYSFESFARISDNTHSNSLKEIMSALTWMFPIGQEGISKLKSSVSLRCMARFLKDEDLSSKQNAIYVLKELILADQGLVEGLMEIEGIAGTLFQIVKVPICPKATKACLVVIYHMMLGPEKNGEITLKLARMGLVSLILEILVDGDKSVCEMGLGVLDTIFDIEEGREIACTNALTLALLVKKILRVSDIATDFAISSLWKMCVGKNYQNALREAMQLGAFQKLLVVLQVGCGERTKEKATELLKLMNSYRNEFDCFDSSMRFKCIKRPS